MSEKKFGCCSLLMSCLKRLFCSKCIFEAKHVGQLIGSILIFSISRLYFNDNNGLEMLLVTTTLIIMLFLLTEKSIGNSNTFNFAALVMVVAAFLFIILEIDKIGDEQFTALIAFLGTLAGVLSANITRDDKKDQVKIVFNLTDNRSGSREGEVATPPVKAKPENKENRSSEETEEKS